MTRSRTLLLTSIALITVCVVGGTVVGVYWNEIVREYRVQQGVVYCGMRSEEAEAVLKAYRHEFNEGATKNKTLIYEQRLWSTNFPHNTDSGAEFYERKARCTSAAAER